MHLLFRVDAGDSVGLGHFYRSMALANTLVKQGIRLTFCHAPSPFWSKVDTPFPAITLTSGNEEQHMMRLIAERECNVFYVDGIISLSKNFIDQIRQKSIPVVFYQNIGDSRHLCDIFILPSLHHDSHFFKKFSSTTSIYQGLEYVIFNEQVYQLARSPKKPPKTVNLVGIATGGSDPRGVLLTLYNLIDHHELENINFIYFYGSDFLYKEKIPPTPEDNVKFLPFDQQRISGVDIIISTFGVSTFEFMYQGLPVISLGHQPTNAEASRKVAKRTGGLVDLGLIDELSRSRVNQVLTQLIRDKDRRATLSMNATQAIDDEGRERVARILISLAD